MAHGLSDLRSADPRPLGRAFSPLDGNRRACTRFAPRLPPARREQPCWPAAAVLKGAATQLFDAGTPAQLSAAVALEAAMRVIAGAGDGHAASTISHCPLGLHRLHRLCLMRGRRLSWVRRRTRLVLLDRDALPQAAPTSGATLSSACSPGARTCTNWSKPWPSIASTAVCELLLGHGRLDYPPATRIWRSAWAPAVKSSRA